MSNLNQKYLNLLKMIENNMTIDEVIMCDTGVEFEDMYNHIEKVTSGAIEPDVTDTVKALKWLYKEYMRVLNENYSRRDLL